MKKFGALLIISCFLIAACSPPAPDMTDVTDDSSSAQSDSYSLNETSITNPNEKDPMTNSSTVKNSVSDFATIAATEATIKTTKGDIVVTLYREETPVTTANFLDLASKGFYDGIVFHRVIADFMAQVGDPQTKDESKKAVWGTGGPGYTIIDEFNDSLKHDTAGVLSMANTGQPSTGGSQFFITFEPTPWLDGKHTVFGRVTQGLDVLKNIEQGDSITTITYK